MDSNVAQAQSGQVKEITYQDVITWKAENFNFWGKCTHLALDFLLLGAPYWHFPIDSLNN